MYSQVKFNGFRRRLGKRRFWESLVQGRVSNRFSRRFPALGFAAHFGKILKNTSRLLGTPPIFFNIIYSTNIFYLIKLTKYPIIYI